MRKLYLLLDEWKNDKNFVGSELEEIKKYFDITVVCNDFDDKSDTIFPKDVKFYFYNRRKAPGKIKALLYALFDSSTWKEINRTRGENSRASKISEIIRFYINAELFYQYLRNNGLISKKSDAIYYSYWYFWKCFAITKYKMNYSDISVITRAHGYDLYKDQIPTNWQPFKQLMDKLVDKIVFISEYGMDYYFREYGIKKSSKHSLYKLGTRNEYGLNPETKTENVFRIVSCSSVIELKRVHLIVEALKLIDDINIEWIHFGNGILFEDVKKMAYEFLGKKDNILFVFPGRVNNSKILKYYSTWHVDAFIMTSRSEGNPVSVIEAMSFGIPIISTNICNMSNLIGDNGILISENPDALEISNAIHKINENSCTVDVMRKASYEIWSCDYREEYNNKKFVNEILMNL